MPPSSKPTRVPWLTRVGGKWPLLRRVFQLDVTDAEINRSLTWALCFRFLLHYVARDEVTLHARGTGGVPEVRNAIEGYGECSPLYGFLQYRRRKVIIRYMPEGLSRLILGTLSCVFSPKFGLISPSSKQCSVPICHR